MKQQPKVSVCMITYGHEKFIEQAVNGVLMQECDFEVELIIANDCSPDQTDAVIQSILKNHPRASWIQYIKHDKNLGAMRNFIYALQECKGEFIALCDGDDYWTDPLKLQKQVAFLENNLDYVLCFHQVNILMTNGEIVDDFITKVPGNYETIETLAQLGNYIHTPSVVFRNVIKKFPFEFVHTPIGDFFLYMMLAEHGKLKYLENKMCLYRYGVGVYSRNSSMKILQMHINEHACILSYLTDENIKNIILKRNLNLVLNMELVCKRQYISNNYLAENKSIIDLLKIGIKSVFYKLNHY